MNRLKLINWKIIALLFVSLFITKVFFVPYIEQEEITLARVVKDFIVSLIASLFVAIISAPKSSDKK